MNVIILGGGRVGSIIALDLANDKKYNVTICDINEILLKKISARCSNISTIRKDISKPEDVTSLVNTYDVVINAVPGFMGFETAKAIIKAKKNSICISFYKEDPFQLDKLALKNNVTMIMDCGLYPGMGSALIMQASMELDKIDSILTYVGGLPQIREWPSEYKAVFSPIDVIEEYIRPARFIVNGGLKEKPALSDSEYIFFPKIGTLEAFNTDGLRTMIKTINASNMKEKTLRYPGHIEKMIVLRELGFFNKNKTIRFDNIKISPLEFTSKILFPNWKMKDGEADITIFRSIINGIKNGKKSNYTIELFDKYCPNTNITSMARTTGYTASIALRMVVDGLYLHKGISPPEYMGKKPECMNYLLKELKKRGVNWKTIKSK